MAEDDLQLMLDMKKFQFMLATYKSAYYLTQNGSKYVIGSLVSEFTLYSRILYILYVTLSCALSYSLELWVNNFLI